MRVPLHAPRQNLLLAALPDAELASLTAHLELVPMRLGDAVYESGEELRHVYFPTTSIVSLLYVTESGDSLETAGVGNEGLVGISLYMGGITTLGSAVVQTAGHAYRLGRGMALAHFEQAGALRALFLRYTQALIAQTAQTAACTRHHSLYQQLCRWLLLTLDRIPSGELVITQDFVASLLGVRTEGMTEAAETLQREGLIRCGRGHITVLNRLGLETRTCECYGAVRKELRRLLPQQGLGTSKGP